MTCVILIGFDYYWCDDESSLTGAIRDLKYAYSFAKKSFPDKIVIITDIDPDENEDKNITSSEDLLFLNKIKSITRIVHSREQFENVFVEYIEGVNHLFIYYSGHAEDNAILCPYVQKVQKTLDPKNKTKVIYDITNTPTDTQKSRLLYSPINLNTKNTRLIVSRIDFNDIPLTDNTLEVSLIDFSMITNLAGKPARRFAVETKGPRVFDVVGKPARVFDVETKGPRVFDVETKGPKIYKTEPILFSDIKTLLTTHTHKKAQILFIMDCCYGNGLDLPFIMNRSNGVYELKSIHYKIPHQEIVCISSSLQHQSSLSIGSGSLFTYIFFNKIHQMKTGGKDMRFIELIKEIGFETLNNYQQTFNIHASRPNIKSIWHWVFGRSKYHIFRKNNTINIKSNSNLKVRKKI